MQVEDYLLLAQRNAPRRGNPERGRPGPGEQRRRYPPVLRGPGPHAGDWLRQHQGLSAEEQERALQQDPRYRRLDPERQERLRKRLQEFNSLPPEQQERILQRMETWEHLTEEQQQQARRLFRSFRRLPQDRKDALAGALRELRGMSPEERQQAIDSEPYRNRFSDEELDLLRGAGKLDFGPQQQEERGSVPE
jgi:hypothetical protein